MVSANYRTMSRALERASSKEASTPKLSRREDALLRLRIIEEYAEDLRQILNKLRPRLH